jgi:hypothetical protein
MYGRAMESCTPAPDDNTRQSNDDFLRTQHSFLGTPWVAEHLPCRRQCITRVGTWAVQPGPLEGCV